MLEKGEWVGIWGIVMLEILAPIHPASYLHRIADNKGELAVIGFRIRLSSLLIFHSELLGVLGLLFVMYAVEVLLNNLSVLRFC